MKLALLGVGLIGGSIGLAARSRAGADVTGYDPDRRALAAALELGAIDEPADDVAAAVDGAQMVFVAAPVGALPAVVREALAAAGADCVVSDVGSTKRGIVASIQDGRFIGGHPLAGGEAAGVEHARADLFDGATWYLTPSAQPSTPSAQASASSGAAPAQALQRLCGLIATLGAQPVMIDAAAHDRLMAHLSHLPHVLANVLVSGAARALEREQRGLGGGPVGAGPSFRDATRVAGANTAIWADIYLSNSDALIEALDDVIARLQSVRTALADRDAGALVAWNERAHAEHERLTGAASPPDS